MKKTFTLVSILLLCAFVSAGCAHYSTDLGAITGTNIQDLEKARADGKVKTVALSYDAAFDKVTEILKSNNLTIFETNREKQYIVAMGFPKQIDTTRVGIFFESRTDGETKITLSSLSSTTLVKAEGIIFGELGTDVESLHR